MAQNQAPKSERTERPTPKRVDKAYEKGNVPRSQDAGQAATLGAFLLWALFGGASFAHALGNEMRVGFSSIATIGDPTTLVQSLRTSATQGMTILLPVSILLAAIAVTAQVAQFGFRPKKKPINFELNKLNPVNGIKKVVSPENFMAAFKALAKLAAYTAIAGLVIGPAWPAITGLMTRPTGAIAPQIVDTGTDLLVRALAFGIFVAIIDLGFSRYRWFRNLYMTKKEIRDELKESEGDPHIRSKRRSRQMELARARMLDAVESATVVVTNPTHVAVALLYESNKADVPVVVAKGKGHMAQRIRERAQEHSVPLVEDPPLARALERVCKVGEHVPKALFKAVAEVIAYVLTRRKGRYEPHDESLDALTRAEARK